MILAALAAMMMLDGGVIHLAPGETHLKAPIEVAKGRKSATIRGDPHGSVLIMDVGFKGRAAIVAEGVSDLTISGFEIRGNRKELKSDWYLPPGDTPFADYYNDNGIVVRASSHVIISDVRFTSIRAFPVLIHASSDIALGHLKIEDCGTLTRAGRNNTTGGILLEEGASRFSIENSTIRNVTGTAIWTHSYGRSPRQSDGIIRNNEISRIGRDAIQIGHATRIRVEDNRGAELGFPIEYVDVEHQGFAVAIDTAGNVDHALYTNNNFTDVNGECIDLDGFHDGAVTRNSCVNLKPAESYPASHYGMAFANHNPAMSSVGVTIADNLLQGFAFGALFLAGSSNVVERNRFLDLNRAHCGATPVNPRCNYALEQPELLRSGIYLAGNGGRPTLTRSNVIRSNVITGFNIEKHCIAAGPGVHLSENVISGNSCRDR